MVSGGAHRELARPLMTTVEAIGRRLPQIDETPVRVLDQRVKGKGGRGFLGSMPYPAGMWFWNSDRQPRAGAGATTPPGLRGTIQTTLTKSTTPSAAASPRWSVSVASRMPAGICNQGGAARTSPWRSGSSPQIRRLYRIEDEIRGLPPANVRRDGRNGACNLGR